MIFEALLFSPHLQIYPHGASKHLSVEANHSPQTNKASDSTKSDGTYIHAKVPLVLRPSKRDETGKPVDKISRSLYEPTITVKEAKDFLLGNFEILDQNNDGFVEAIELKEFPAANGKEAKARAFLKNNLKEITSAERSTSHLARGTDGITKEDMIQYSIEKDPDYAVKQLLVKQMELSFARNLSKLDTNNDGHLNKAELQKAATDPSMDVGAKYMVEFLRRGYPTASSIDYKSRKSWFSDYMHPMDSAADTMYLGVGKADMKRIETEYSVDSAASDARSKALILGREATFFSILPGALFFRPYILPATFVAGLVTYGTERVHTVHTSNDHRVAIANTLDSMNNVSRIGACE